ncbi:MAG TPA: hypothetical protein VK841_07075 [Polyangiaceae bacterium]|jgi:hypothetical protein|nr:hypothetical protein [Polyangiaceae bacterium]
MSDSRRLAGEASRAQTGFRASVNTSATVVVSSVLALSAVVLGCGPSETSGGYYGQAGYGQSGTCPGNTGCAGTTGWSGSAGAYAGTTGTYSGAAGTASGSTGAPGMSGASEIFDAGGPGADGGVPPMVVEVDPNGTLSATPGLGVGVFTQYVSGGHWLVWWTCDTEVTGQSCLFTVSVTPVQGTFSNVELTQDGTMSEVAGTGAPSFALTSSTSNGRNQVTFDTQPGASIELSTSVEPSPNENYLFFVQSQRVNGGYQGNLTDPLILEPSSP